jgi:hypothetical protein
MNKKENNQSESSHAEDAFEKEAAKGFGLLSDKETADLKAETDQAMHRLLTPAAEPQRSVYYWLAAALLILGGFALFLLLRPSATPQMALHQKPVPSPAASVPSTRSELQTSVSTSQMPPSSKTASKQERNLTKKILRSSPLPSPSFPAKSQEDKQRANTMADADETEPVTMALAMESKQKELILKNEQTIYKAKSAKARTAPELELKPSALRSFDSRSRTPALSPSDTADIAELSFQGGTAALRLELKKIVGDYPLSSPLRLHFYVNKSAQIEKLEFQRPEDMAPQIYKKLIKKMSAIRGFIMRGTALTQYPVHFALEYLPD